VAQNPNTTKRLILKDGSYQPATKWEVKGDRVRYYSSERSEWEEIPTSLIDWAATDKWNKEREKADISAETKEVSAELEAERKAQEAQSPTVAPGVRLPANGGVFLLDRFQGRQEIVEVVQNGGQVNKQMGRNILRAAINPIASAKQSIELEGTRARVQSHDPRPVIFVDVDADNDPSTGPTPADAAHRFRLVRLQVKNNVRVVGNLKIALTGKVSQQQTFVDAVSAPFSGEWVKVQPVADLTPGEYALVEMLGDKQINLYVWDFGVDPHAPENPTAWKPVQPGQVKTGTDKSPVLDKRPK
ncbi:MAG: hypothetical protein JO187_09920, partial [Acidobacteria bacterium]|nr:hypothetical protein [Acidobacteriota bacterium]